MRDLPLVFIHGIKGGALVNGRGKQVWLRARHAFRLSVPDLSLPLTWTDETQDRDDLEPTAPLSSVAGKGIYGPFMDWANEHRSTFYPFAYDWRRDNTENVDRFLEFLREKNELHDGPIQIAAHSMGGLITWVAMKEDPGLFHSILFAGVPFGTGVDFIRDMHIGAPIGFNKKIMTPRVHHSFASPYCFFPTEPDDSRLVLSTDPIEHDWYNATHWRDQELSIYSGKTGPVDLNHLENALRQARKFRQRVEDLDTVPGDHPPVAILYSEEHDTLHTLVKNGPRARLGWDFESGEYRAGDGRVSAAAARIPAEIEYQKHTSSRNHHELYHETDQVGKILSSLAGT